MEKHAPVEERPVERDISGLSLDSRQGVIQGFKDIAMGNETKPMEKMRALDKIAELKGFKLDKQIKDLRHVSDDELEELIQNLVLPMLHPYGVRDGSPELILDRAARADS